MRCETLEEIGKRENLTKETVSQVCQKIPELEKSDKAAAEHATDFNPSIYNL